MLLSGNSISISLLQKEIQNWTSEAGWYLSSWTNRQSTFITAQFILPRILLNQFYLSKFIDIEKVWEASKFTVMPTDFENFCDVNITHVSIKIALDNHRNVQQFQILIYIIYEEQKLES